MERGLFSLRKLTQDWKASLRDCNQTLEPVSKDVGLYGLQKHRPYSAAVVKSAKPKKVLQRPQTAVVVEVKQTGPVYSAKQTVCSLKQFGSRDFKTTV